MNIQLIVNSDDYCFIFNNDYFSNQSWFYDYRRKCFEQTVDCDYQPIQNYKRFRKMFK